MVEEIYKSSSQRRTSVSPRQLRALKKKALQSYKHIGTIKEISQEEMKKASEEAEKKLNQYLTTSSKQNDGKQWTNL